MVPKNGPCLFVLGVLFKTPQLSGLISPVYNIITEVRQIGVRSKMEPLFGILWDPKTWFATRNCNYSARANANPPTQYFTPHYLAFQHAVPQPQSFNHITTHMRLINIQWMAWTVYERADNLQQHRIVYEMARASRRGSVGADVCIVLWGPSVTDCVALHIAIATPNQFAGPWCCPVLLSNLLSNLANIERGVYTHDRTCPNVMRTHHPHQHHHYHH